MPSRLVPGGVGPCPAGHQFVVPADSKDTRASCTCKPNYVQYADGLCYRLHTQGPCGAGRMLANATSCTPVPCRRGRLFFPRERTCYKIGSRGPCANGQVVLYDYSARPSIDGISYNGVCGCTSALKSSGRCQETASDRCEDTPGAVLVNRTCHRLYTQGPCADGEWLVARRTPKGGEEGLWRDRPSLSRARCVCRPGYTRTTELEDNSLLLPARCQPPAVGIARFLNENVRAGNF